MNARRAFLCLAVLAGLLAACGGRAPSGEGRATPESAASAGESRAVAPSPAGGDFCEEHGVAEAVCTKCRPALIPVFQAKGDWCAEHGFPESFCPICHPERGGKPAAEVTGDEAPPDGLRIRFRSPEVARQAGIRTARAEERAGGAPAQAPARIAWDPRRAAEVGARLPGVVLTLEAEVGDRVEAGARLAVLESAEAGAERGKLQAARARAGAARAALEREERLLARGVSAEKDVLEARRELAAALAEERAAETALRLAGAAEEGGSRAPVVSPIAGTVVRREATIGRLAAAGDLLFEIADTSEVRAECDVPEREAAGIEAGAVAAVALDGLDGAEIEGSVVSVAPVVDPATRTVRVRVALPNPDGTLRAGMLGRARIGRPAAAGSVAVPRAALQAAGEVALVFVRLAEDRYEVRRVSVAGEDGEAALLASGVAAEEEVVTEGSFLLKTETLKGKIGAGCCEIEE